MMLLLLCCCLFGVAAFILPRLRARACPRRDRGWLRVSAAGGGKHLTKMYARQPPPPPCGRSPFRAMRGRNDASDTIIEHAETVPEQRRAVKDYVHITNPGL